MKKLLAGCVCALACVVSADTYHWTGAVDGRWTNPNNWREGTVPGRYIDSGATVGQTGDVVVFGDNLTGNAVTTIDFTDVYSIYQVLTEGTNQYTYGTAESQFVPLEPFGTFSAAETPATPPAAFQAKLRLGVELMATNWGGETMTVRNNSTREFVFDKYAPGTTSPNRPSGVSGGQAGILFSGSGNIRLPNGIGYNFMHVAMTGTLIIDSSTKPRGFLIDSLAGAGAQRVEITSRGSLFPGECGNFMGIYRETIVFGEGPFMFASGPARVCENNVSQPLTIHCPVTNLFIDGETPEGSPTLWFRYGGGVVTMAGENTMRGLAHVGQTAVLATGAFGLRGTYGGFGDMDFLFGGNGTLRHTGGDDTMDRVITLTNLTADAAGKAQLEQAGTGAWTVNSPVYLAGGRTSGTLTLKGNVLAPATFAGTIDSRISIEKSGGGDWTFTPQNDYSGAVSVSGGTLGLGKSLHLTSLAATSGSTDIRVTEGCVIEIDTVTATANKKLDFVLLDTGSSVRIGNGTAGAAMEGVTLNGHAAVLDESLNLVASPEEGNIWKRAASGSWDEAVNWWSGVAPNPELNTYIDAPGGDYTVTLDGSEVTTTNLFLKNRGSGTATLLVTNDAVLTVRGHTTSNPFLTLGTGAKVDVVDATLRLKDQGNAVGYYSGKSSLSFDQAEISVRGAGSFIHRGIVLSEFTGTETGNFNTFLTFGTGTLTFEDEATFATEYESGRTVFYHTFSPSRAGETMQVSFKGNSRTAFPGAAWTLSLNGNSGHSILEFDTGYTGQMNGWSCMHVGSWTGVGELRVLRGDIKTGGWGYLWVATPENDGSTKNTLVSTGRVVIAEGGKLTVPCQAPSENTFCGVQFGHGTALTGARGTSYVYGEMLLAGTYEQERGVFLVGTGANGHGVVRQTGGLASVVANTKSETPTTCGEVAVGVFGGTGRYELEDGVFTTAHNVFIGGAFTNDLRRYHRNYAALDRYHDAQGTLAVSGGSFNTTTNIVLGRDGTGWIELSGTGTVSAASIVVANTEGQAASGIRFTADAAGRCGRIAPATKLSFLPGAVVTVDVAEMAAQAQPRRVAVWNLDEAPAGVSDVDFVLEGNEGLRIPNRLELSADGRTLAWNVTTGTVITLR